MTTLIRVTWATSTKAPKLRVASRAPGAVSSRSGSAGLGLSKAAAPVLGGSLAYSVQGCRPARYFFTRPRALASARASVAVRGALLAAGSTLNMKIPPLSNGNRPVTTIAPMLLEEQVSAEPAGRGNNAERLVAHLPRSVASSNLVGRAGMSPHFGFSLPIPASAPKGMGVRAWPGSAARGFMSY